jgi:dihydropteroate synthase
MHMQGKPRTMQESPSYQDVTAEVFDFLMQRVAACELVGISRQRMVLDPGFGFGKSLQHNLTLLAELQRFSRSRLPLLAGISRKSMIGTLLNGAPVEQRLYGSIAAAVMAYERGAAILRVHDVRETVEALTIADAIKKINKEGSE